MFIKESSLENFGSASVTDKKQSFLEKILQKTGLFTYSAAKPIMVILIIITGIAIYGITQIQINDNPVKWFSTSHPIRKADIELNKHFGGTYMAYLVLDSAEPNNIDDAYLTSLRKSVSDKAREFIQDNPNITEIIPQIFEEISKLAPGSKTKIELLDKLIEYADDKQETANDEDSDIWYEFSDFFDLAKEQTKPFKNPDVLRYMSQLQDYILKAGLVGKSTSVADIVKKVNKELIDGKEDKLQNTR